MKDSLTQITMVLDRSGSMSTVRDATIAGFNEFVEGQKGIPGEAHFTLIQFDTEDPYLLVFDGKPVKDVPKLTAETYIPRGGTPLHDCLGRAIDDLGAKLAKTADADRPGKVFVVVMTDGLENSSHEYTAPRLAEMIKHQSEAYKWEFIFLGANQDAVLTGERLNIPKAASMTFAATAAGTRSSYDSVSHAVAQRRLGRTSAVAFSKEDRERAKRQH